MKSTTATAGAHRAVNFVWRSPMSQGTSWRCRCGAVDLPVSGRWTDGRGDTALHGRHIQRVQFPLWLARRASGAAGAGMYRAAPDGEPEHRPETNVLQGIEVKQVVFDFTMLRNTLWPGSVLFTGRTSPAAHFRQHKGRVDRHKSGKGEKNSMNAILFDMAAKAAPLVRLEPINGASWRPSLNPPKFKCPRKPMWRQPGSRLA